MITEEQDARAAEILEPTTVDGGEIHLTPPAPPEVSPVAEKARVQKSRRRLVVAVLLIAGLGAGLFIGVPRAIYAWNHASTDDATVNSHVTYVSARVGGQAKEVLVDDNLFVEAGTPLVRLDSTQFDLAVEQRKAELSRAKIQVAQEQAAFEVATAQLEQVRADVRGKVAGLKAAWFLVATVQDFVHFQTATLQAQVATLHKQQANLKLAQEEFDRVQKLGIQSVSQEEIDQRKSVLIATQAEVESAQAGVVESRSMLGIGTDAADPSSVPANVAETFNGTQYAVATFEGTLAQLGIKADLTMPPNLQAIKAQLQNFPTEWAINNSPAVLAAQAQVAAAKSALGGAGYDPSHPENQPSIVEAQKALEQAQLQQSYTEIRAPLAGYVNRRAVNVGSAVALGQALLAIRPLNDVWVDANFKETQLADLRIGQKVDLYVDAYPDKVFKGRIAGFSPGTGAVMSLLPPENATGNFVKVVQRLPVRIELTEPNPKDTPLFAGLSVEPEVDLRAAPEGPDAGARLLSSTTPTPQTPNAARATSVAAQTADFGSPSAHSLAKPSNPTASAIAGSDPESAVR